MMTEKRRNQNKVGAKKPKKRRAGFGSDSAMTLSQAPAAGLSCCKPWRVFIQREA